MKRQAPISESPTYSFPLCGRTWHLQCANMEALWEAMVEKASSTPEPDERLPYWASLWPSSLMLAEWLHSHQPHIQNRNCLDLGCGLGFTALVGQWLGAHVLAVDYEEQALAFARQNAALNAVPQPHWQVMDWRKPTLPSASIDYLWAGDIMYERAFAAPIAAFIRHALTPNGVAWFAEPGRTIFQHLLDELPQHGLTFSRALTQEITPLTAQAVPVPVSVWEIKRGE